MIFDFSFGEIGLIAVVALVVLGPERLPRVARTAGALVRRARTSWQSVRDEIERELEAEDLKRSLAEARQAVADLHSDVRNELHSTDAQMRAAVDPTAADVAPTEPAPLADADNPTIRPPDGTPHERG